MEFYELTVLYLICTYQHMICVVEGSIPRELYFSYFVCESINSSSVCCRFLGSLRFIVHVCALPRKCCTWYGDEDAPPFSFHIIVVDLVFFFIKAFGSVCLWDVFFCQYNVCTPAYTEQGYTDMPSRNTEFCIYTIFSGV